jgi:hypothetical protein
VRLGECICECICECVSARAQEGGVAESGKTLCKCWRNFSKSDLAKTQANQEEARPVLSVCIGADSVDAPGVVREQR